MTLQQTLTTVNALKKLHIDFLSELHPEIPDELQSNLQECALH